MSNPMPAFDNIENLPTINDPTFKCKDVMALCLTPVVLSSQWNVPPTHKLWQHLLDKAGATEGPVDFPRNKDELLMNLMHGVIDFENNIRSSILSANQLQQKPCKLAFSKKVKPRASNELAHRFLLLKVMDLALLPVRYDDEGHINEDFRLYQPSYVGVSNPSSGAIHYMERVKEWPKLVMDVINWDADAKALKEILGTNLTESTALTARELPTPDEELNRKRQILGDMIKGVEGLESEMKLKYVHSNLMWAALGLLGCSLVSTYSVD